MKKMKIVRITFNHISREYNIFVEDEFVVLYNKRTDIYKHRPWGAVDHNIQVPNILCDDMFFQISCVWDFKYLDIELMRVIQKKVHEGLFEECSTMQDSDDYFNKEVSVLFEYETIE